MSANAIIYKEFCRCLAPLGRRWDHAGAALGRRWGGAVATLVMGITGVIIGCGVYSLIYKQQISPITSVGLVCGTLGAFTILLFYRLLGGFLIDEAGSSAHRRRYDERYVPRRRGRRRRRSRRYSTYDYED